jgi:hypothetical protein
LIPVDFVTGLPLRSYAGTPLFSTSCISSQTSAGENPCNPAREGRFPRWRNGISGILLGANGISFSNPIIVRR